MNRAMAIWRFKQIRNSRARIKLIRKMLLEPDGYNVWATNPRLANEEIMHHAQVINACRSALKEEF